MTVAARIGSLAFAKFRNRSRHNPSRDSHGAVPWNATELLATHDPESIIRILKCRRNAGPRGAAAHFDVMPPGPSTRRAPFTARRTRRIALGRTCVIILRVPIRAPFLIVLAALETAV